MMERDNNVEKAILSELKKPSSKVIDRVTLHNQILKHNFTTDVEQITTCHLLGCCQNFSLTLIPNQLLYPKYCEEHRSEFRRQNFLRQMNSQPTVFHFSTVKVFSVQPLKTERP